MSNLLPYVSVSTGAEHKASVIWLHGLGADGHDFEPIVPELKLPAELGVNFIFPHAPVIPVTINGGMSMRAWYDIRNADLSQREDEAGVRLSSQEVSKLVEAELAKGIPSDKIFIAGFSQGGAVALHYSTRTLQKLAGVIALSTYLTVADKLTHEMTKTNLKTPFLMAHGSQDPVVPMQRGQFSAQTLKDNGYSVQWLDYPMQHAVCLEEIQQVSLFIQKHLS